MSGYRSVAFTLVLTGVCSGAGAADRRVAPTATECPADTPVRRIDASGVTDACAQEAVPVCAEDLWLRVDFDKVEDRCVRPRTGGRRHSRAVTSVGAPACTATLMLEVRPGADVCQRQVLPTCVKGFHLEARAGEDRCVVDGQKK